VKYFLMTARRPSRFAPDSRPTHTPKSVDTDGRIIHHTEIGAPFCGNAPTSTTAYVSAFGNDHDTD